jgi:hypothetical protein
LGSGVREDGNIDDGGDNRLLYSTRTSSIKPNAILTNSCTWLHDHRSDGDDANILVNNRRNDDEYDDGNADDNNAFLLSSGSIAFGTMTLTNNRPSAQISALV